VRGCGMRVDRAVDRSGSEKYQGLVEVVLESRAVDGDSPVGESS
jgi:hypothetical protein